MSTQKITTNKSTNWSLKSEKPLISWNKYVNDFTIFLLNLNFHGLENIKEIYLKKNFSYKFYH